MSYRDPKLILDERFSAINQGVSKLLGETTKKIGNFNANQQRERDLYKKNMDRAASKSASRASGSFDKAKAASDKFTSGLYGEAGAPTKEGILFNDQINSVFSNWGTELNDQISAVQAAGGSEMEISALTDKYIGKLNQFTTDMANWEAAREEFMLAKKAGLEGGENSVGSLLSDPELQKNPELLNMFTAMTDDELDNLYITIDPNGSTRISMGTMTDGNFNAQSSTDISAWARSHKDSPDGNYFNVNEQFATEDYEAMVGVFEDLEGNDSLKRGGQLDKDLVREYLLEGDVGRTVMDSFLNDNSKNKWASLYDSYESTRRYTDDGYLDLIIENSWNDLYSPTQTKAKPSTAKGGKAPKVPLVIPINAPHNSPDSPNKDNPDFGKGAGVLKRKEEKDEKPGFNPKAPWPKGVPKPSKNATKEELEKIAKDELAKLTKEERKELDKMKTRPLTEEEKKKIGKGTRSKSGKGMTMDEIDAFLGIPIFSFLMKKRI